MTLPQPLVCEPMTAATLDGALAVLTEFLTIPTTLLRAMSTATRGRMQRALH